MGKKLPWLIYLSLCMFYIFLKLQQLCRRCNAGLKFFSVLKPKRGIDHDAIRRGSSSCRVHSVSMICCGYRYFVYRYLLLCQQINIRWTCGINFGFKFIHFNHSSGSSVGKLFFYRLAILNWTAIKRPTSITVFSNQSPEIIRRTEKDGSCTFYHNSFRT